MADEVKARRASSPKYTGSAPQVAALVRATVAMIRLNSQYGTTPVIYSAARSTDFARRAICT